MIEGKLQAPFQRLVPLLVPGEVTRRTDICQRVNEGLRLPERLSERYRPIARRVASQAEIYLSRGCPYDCAFCMERAKRDVSWRSLEPLQAVEELHRLDQFLDLSRWTLFIAALLMMA